MEESLYQKVQYSTPGLSLRGCTRTRVLERSLLCAFSDDSHMLPGFSDSLIKVLQKAEAKHLEEVGSRLRSQRLEHEQQKKEREVKITDRIPPQKRLRPCKSIVTFTSRTHSHASSFLGSGPSQPSQPKTLMQKTYSSASKLHKTVYNARFTIKGKPISKPPSVPLLPTPSPSYASRVTVTTVKHRQPPSSSPSSSTGPNSRSSTSLATSSSEPATYVPPLSPCKLSIDDCRSSTLPSGKKPETVQRSALLNQTLPSPGPRPKKKPTSSLFMPKDRAYSQRPTISR